MTTPDNPSNEPTTGSERATVRSGASSAEFAAGTRIDHYVIRERIGEGGFAVVYRAEQTDPNTRSLLGGAIAGQGRYEQAEPILVDAYERLKDDAEAPEIRRREAMQRVIDLYEAWDRPDDADEWRARE